MKKLILIPILLLPVLALAASPASIKRNQWTTNQIPNLISESVSAVLGTTNIVVVSGSGEATANGTFTWDGVDSYTNATAVKITYNVSVWNNWVIGTDPELPFYTASEQGGQSLFPGGTRSAWSAVVGTEPLPIATYSTAAATVTRDVATNQTFYTKFPNGIEPSHINTPGSFLEYGVDSSGRSSDDHKTLPSANIATTGATNYGYVSAIIGGRDNVIGPGGSVVMLASGANYGRAYNNDIAMIASEFSLSDNIQGVAALIACFRSTNYANASSVLIQDSYSEVTTNTSFSALLNTERCYLDKAFNCLVMGQTNIVDSGTNVFLFGQGLTSTNLANTIKIGFGDSYLEITPSGMSVDTLSVTNLEFETISGNIDVTNTVSASGGYYFPTNAPSNWPATARVGGEAFWGNSNGVVYLLISAPGSTAWVSTNKIAP